MRPDMKHLLVERGHEGTAWTRQEPKSWAARCRFRNDEDDPHESWVEPPRQPQFSENLSPLYRYLRKQVGRPWDKVYSEIRRFVNANSAVQLHILQHLYDRLAVHVWEDSDGHLWHIEGWGGTTRLENSRYRDLLYVCPRTGLIRRVKKKRIPTPQKKPLDHLPATHEDHEYRKINGQWYEVWWDMVPHGSELIRSIVHKRQLGRKALRKLGLRD